MYRYELVDEDQPGCGSRISELVNNDYEFLGYAINMPNMGIYRKEMHYG